MFFYEEEILKKIIIFLFISILINLNIVKAQTLNSENLPYYVKIEDIANNTTDHIQVKKVYDSYNFKPVFNIFYNHYETGSNFTKYDNFDESIWKQNLEFYNSFMTSIYYGYLSNPIDFNYFLTQVFIWRQNPNLRITIVDASGTKVKDYETKYNSMSYYISRHYVRSSFFGSVFRREIWDTDKFTYYNDEVILDNPDNINFEFRNDDHDLYITSLKPGNYNLFFTKNYEQEMHCFSDGTNIYWQSLKGPANISQRTSFIVTGLRLHLNEQLIGVNDRFGDASINDFQYEIYLNDELKYQFNRLDEIYLKSNSEYLIKDVSTNNSFNNIDDLSIEVRDTEYVLTITKEVISKNISINISTDENYYVYLESNNELYEVINKDTDLITLPYGTYYIKNDSNNYNEVLIVHDSRDEILNIGDQEIINELDVLVNEEDDQLEEVSTIKEIQAVENVENEGEENINYVDEVINNPKTGDNINSYFLSSVASLFVFTFAYILNKKYL